MKLSVLVLLLSLSFSTFSFGQIVPAKDTVQRDFGISINWRYLPFPPQNQKVSDIIGGFHFAFETRAHKFWIQTGTLVNWDSSRGFDKGHSFLFNLSTPYEFQLLKRRLYLGFGPTFNYYYTHETFSDWDGLSKDNDHGIGFGVIFEITVPIWKGLSLETCSDASIGAYFEGDGSPDLFFPSSRLVSLGINYRIPIYPKPSIK